MPISTPHWASRLSPPPSRATRSVWEGSKLCYHEALWLGRPASPLADNAERPGLNHRTQLSLAVHDFEHNLRSNPRTVGTFFPPLDKSDIRHPLARSSKHTEGCIDGKGARLTDRTRF